MKDKEKIEKEEAAIQRAAYAQQVLDNPAYKEAKIIVEADLFKKFSSVKSNDLKSLQEVKMMHSNFLKLLSVFERAIQDGKVAESRLQTLKKRIFNK